MSKHPELNGVANIEIALFIAKEDRDLGLAVDLDLLEQRIKEQTDLLSRYIMAISKSARDGSEFPKWHEIIANKKMFPNHKGE